MEYLKQIVWFVLGTLAVVFAAYYTTYFIASRSRNLAQGNMIRIIDRFSLARDKSVCLLEVCGKVYLIVLSGQGATLIDTPDPEIVAAMAESRTLQGGFATLMESFRDRLESMKTSRANADDGEHREETLEQSLKRTGLMHHNYDLGEDDGDPADPTGDGAAEGFPFPEEDGLDEVYRRMMGRRARTQPPEDT